MKHNKRTRHTTAKHRAARHAPPKRHAKRRNAGKKVGRHRSVPGTLDNALAMEKGTVELAGALALAGISMMETAASIAVETPAAVLGAIPRAKRQTKKQAKVLTIPPAPTARRLAMAA